jgi:hypothetical protein
VNGWIYGAESALNEGGRYDGRIEKRELVEAAWDVAARAGTFATETISRRRNATDAVSAPAKSQGWIYGAESSLNEGGRYDGDLTKRQLLASTVAVTRSLWAGGYGGQYVTAYQSLTAIPTMGANTARNRRTMQWALREGDVYDGEVAHEIVERVTFGPLVTRRDGVRIDRTYVYDQADGPVEVPVGQVGVARNDFNAVDNTWSSHLTMRPVTSEIDWLSEEDRSWQFETSRGETANVYVKFTGSTTAAETHVRSATDATWKVVGGRDGQVTDIHVLGVGKIRAVRVEVAKV